MPAYPVDVTRSIVLEPSTGTSLTGSWDVFMLQLIFMIDVKRTRRAPDDDDAFHGHCGLAGRRVLNFTDVHFDITLLA